MGRRTIKAEQFRYMYDEILKVYVGRGYDPPFLFRNIYFYRKPVVTRIFKIEKINESKPLKEYAILKLHSIKSKEVLTSNIQPIIISWLRRDVLNIDDGIVMPPKTPMGTVIISHGNDCQESELNEYSNITIESLNHLSIQEIFKYIRNIKIRLNCKESLITQWKDDIDYIEDFLIRNNMKTVDIPDDIHEIFNTLDRSNITNEHEENQGPVSDIKSDKTSKPPNLVSRKDKTQAQLNKSDIKDSENVKKAIFEREGDSWRVGSFDNIYNYKDLKGFYYLYYLVKYPEKEISYIQMIEAANDNNLNLKNIGYFKEEKTDKKTIQEVKDNINSLNEKMTEIEQDNTINMDEKENKIRPLKNQKRQLEDYLKRNTYRGKIESTADKKRHKDAVWKSIKKAIETIDQHNKNLADHFNKFIAYKSRIVKYHPEKRLFF